MKKTVVILSDSTEFFQQLQIASASSDVELSHVRLNDHWKLASDGIVFIDSRALKNPQALLISCSEKKITAVWVQEEDQVAFPVEQWLRDQLIHDVLLLPLRPLDFQMKLKAIEAYEVERSVLKLNANLSSFIQTLEKDLEVAQSIQKKLIPEKFPPVAGFHVTHQYKYGLKSGGDYLDFFSFEDQKNIGILMSDSTGYGLSSTFMSVILNLTMKMTKTESQSPNHTVNRIIQELKPTIKPKESLSIFYAIINKRNLEMKFVSVGNIFFARQNAEGLVVEDRNATEPFRLGHPLVIEEKSQMLKPEDRLVLMSDGYSSLFPSVKDLYHFCLKHYGSDAIEFMNELNYKLKDHSAQHGGGEDESDCVPEQDCSLMLVDVDSNLLKLSGV